MLRTMCRAVVRALSCSVVNRSLAALALTGLCLVAVATHLFLIGGNPAPAVALLLLSA